MSQARRIARREAAQKHDERVRERVYLRQQIGAAEKLLADMPPGPFGDGGFGAHVEELRSQLRELEK